MTLLRRLVPRTIVSTWRPVEEDARVATAAFPATGEAGETDSLAAARSGMRAFRTAALAPPATTATAKISTTIRGRRLTRTGDVGASGLLDQHESRGRDGRATRL